jgi:hypothetical protein
MLDVQLEFLVDLTILVNLANCPAKMAIWRRLRSEFQFTRRNSGFSPVAVFHISHPLFPEKREWYCS